MRALFLASLSAVLLSACLTSQENPNYEHSTVYRGDSVSSTQYASASSQQANVPSVDISNARYDSATQQYVFSDQAVTLSASHQQPTTYETAPVYAHSAPEIPALPPSFDVTNNTVAAPTTHVAAAPAVVAAPSSSFTTTTTGSVTDFAPAPTDSAFASQEVTGTPGFMALQQSQQQPVAHAEIAPQLPEIQDVPYAPLRAAGTPVPYDYSRNLVTADAVTTGQQIPETVRVLQGASQNYIVQPGDTVYSLSRKTCVGVSVIQSMNGIGADFGINIGQSITLPASVC